ncbi:MAG: CtrA inhibitor SciP [Alphaproteobacteria bacterium]
MGRPARHIGFVVGPEGERITRMDLPPPGTSRWVPRKKAAVVAAVNGGLITLEEACARYEMTVEEFLSWERAYSHHGVSGLRVSELHHRREEEKV